MNYELAKQLKEAEFPQDAEWSRGCWDWPTRLEEATDGSYPDFQWSPEHAEKYKDSYFYFPTLEELIEACGEGFETLSRDTSTETVLWICNNYHDVDAQEKQTFGWYEGSTPTEAVARLFIALNKK